MTLREFTERMSSAELDAQIAFDCAQDENYMKEFNLRTSDNQDLIRVALIDEMFGVIK